MEEKYKAHRLTYELLKDMQEPPEMKAIMDWVGRILSAVDEGKPIVWNQFTFWCEVMIAMDLQPLAPEVWPAAGAPGMMGMPEILEAVMAGGNPILDPAEEAGIPPQLCTAGRAIIGGVLTGTIPPPSMIVMPSYPCDNTRTIYQVAAQLTGAPLYVLDCPYWMDEPEAMEYWVNQYKGLIFFLEEHSGKKLDYDRLKEVAEESNRFVEYWLEGTELLKMKPLPQNGPFLATEVLLNLGLPIATEAVKARLDALKARIARGEKAVPEEKVRVVWNYLPVIWDIALFDWMAGEFGAVTPVAMGSWEHHEPVDTSTPESIIRGMARRALGVHMGRHGRGASDLWIEDTLNAFEQWQCDCIIVNGALGCKWVRGSYGLLRDICRERGIPVMMFDADIADHRVVSQEEVHARIGKFLETVMTR
jgi:benzoyl-CoA reductase/2-hydroxyglutaryl-CoA dehydratase subunit BcrC/BadD/HgdB